MSFGFWYLEVRRSLGIRAGLCVVVLDILCKTVLINIFCIIIYTLKYYNILHLRRHDDKNNNQICHRLL